MMMQQTNNNKRSRPSVRKTALLALVTWMASDATCSAFVPSSSSSSSGASVHTSLHAEAWDGHNSGAMSLPPDLQQALEQKNASRKKFGLKPLSVPQFLELQTQVAQMEQDQVSKAQELQYQKQEQKKQRGGFGNFAKTLFQQTMEDTCFSNFDCESPKVCCDLGVKKMCCANGMLQVHHEFAFEPVPVDMRDHE
eukprot:CAMPEP_0117077404 /NCGR_PEP_ID=MMETSP0472-20121206/54576_1 /TAXON_ID=693140 ORGANISM="Tiarina fusus, Strain LIS" /NCGR_SAMPLE_ID=MMETSP0472 /ASSEMBLY_ACC=CAM_ASM_000603 /LENGTH=194 /DNA_ID=CAMNT_0004803723 /DNA_START=135 /DNA_END=719 /DNA_ORIENTATION=+